MAEEMQLLVGSKANFDELRRLCNTKWNVHIMETRTGMGGHCLPKDLDMLKEELPDNKIFKLSKQINDEFKEKYGE
jgi:UDP-N-acetyl-D-mannosaminuronate dehydrogenase